MTVTTAPVPDSLEQALSPQWLTAALQPRFPGIEVSAVVPGPVVDRISTNARFSIECAGGVPDGLSPALCVKGYFNEIGRAARYVGAPGSVLLPGPRRGDRGAHAAQRVRRYRPGHAARRRHHRRRGVPGRDVPRRQQPLHARPNRPDAHRIRPRCTRRRGPTRAMPTCGGWARGWAACWKCGASRPPSTSSTATSNGPNGQGVPDEVRDAHRLVDTYRSLRADRATAIWCVIHGDAHVGKSVSRRRRESLPGRLATRPTRHVVLRRRLPHRLDTDRRGASTQRTRSVAALLDSLASYGVTPPSWDDAWRAIAYGMLHGFFLWGITTKVQPDDHRDACSSARYGVPRPSRTGGSRWSRKPLTEYALSSWRNGCSSRWPGRCWPTGAPTSSASSASRATRIEGWRRRVSAPTAAASTCRWLWPIGASGPSR